MDAVRGVTKIVKSNSTASEHTTNGSTDFTAFTSNGFTYGASSQLDTASGTPCTWLWKANGAGSANTDGSINSTVSANTTSGFSIVSYTGTGANATVGHGLGAVPKFIMTKNLTSASYGWYCYHASMGNDKNLYLHTSDSQVSGSSRWNSTTPTSSVFSLGTNAGTNGSTNMIAYCFAEKTGYSKFGSHTGNGNADGTFVYTGFKPAFLLVKKYTDAGHWQMVDNKRPGYNVNSNYLRSNKTDAEATDIPFDILSNGFKARSTDGSYNESGQSYIYLAFAEAPLVGSNNVPCTAR